MAENMTQLDDLQRRLGIPGAVRFEEGAGGLVQARITTPFGDAAVFLHGAHVSHYQPAGQKPVLFMSEKSALDPAKPIRGGVPIAFPWFGPKAGDASAPLHGNVRTQPWTVESARQNGDRSVTLVLSLQANEATRRTWPADFALKYRVEVGPALELALEVTNTSDAPFTFEEALHTYFTVGDVREVAVTGLAGVSYLDKTDGMKRKEQGPEPIRIVSETDRVYLNTRSTCVVDDPMWSRRIVIEKSGSDTTVVWNPWIAKAKAMPDFGDEEWPAMLCIETVNAMENAVSLSPQARHEMRAKIRVESR